MRIDLSQLEFIDTYLRAITEDIETKFRVEFEVTSLYRIGDNGVHGQLPLRGLDLGCKDRVIGERVAEYINARWVYDPGRPEKMCAKWHKIEGGVTHLHIQSHPLTERFPHD